MSDGVMTSLNLLSRVRIVLVEPAGALNVGSVARVMKNMGLGHLVLVNPQCDRFSDDARKMAVHAIDVLEAAEEVLTLPEALRGCQRAIATTAQVRSLELPLESPRAALPWLLEPDAAVHSALIFGREDRGLSNEELNYAQRCISIPAHPGYPSLNLAQAVAVCCYELYLYSVQQQPTEDRQAAIASRERITSSSLPISDTGVVHRSAASLEMLEAYYQHLEALLLKIGYLYPQTAASRMEKFRRLFNRAQLSESEVPMLRGILRQMEWALEQDVLPGTIELNNLPKA